MRRARRRHDTNVRDCMPRDGSPLNHGWTRRCRRPCAACSAGRCPSVCQRLGGFAHRQHYARAVPGTSALMQAVPVHKGIRGSKRGHTDSHRGIRPIYSPAQKHVFNQQTEQTIPQLQTASKKANKLLLHMRMHCCKGMPISANITRSTRGLLLTSGPSAKHTNP